MSFHLLQTKVIDTIYRAAEGAKGLQPALTRICKEASAAAKEGNTLIVLSDRNAGKLAVPIPALLVLGAVHHHLIREKLRMKVGLVVESGEARYNIAFSFYMYRGMGCTV